MTIIDRFLQLGLPVDQCVVIGSGLLDALELRTSRDIDLVTTPGLFAALQQSGKWRVSRRHDESLLEKDDAEIWMSWGSNGQPNFDQLFDRCLTIGGVYFANPLDVIAEKQKRATEKDIKDIQLLEGYLNR